MKLSRKFIWIGLIVLVVIGGGGYAYYQYVYLPQQNANSQPVLQTATVRQGNLELLASGTGTLIAPNSVDLAFQTGGQINAINVKVGDTVKAGDVLATVDDTSAQIALVQAKRNLLDLTSPGAIATAQGAVATAETTLESALNHLEYIISPPVLHWEDEVAKAQQAVKDAQTALDANPNDKTLQQKLKDAQNYLEYAQASLVGAQASYTEYYVPNTFTVKTFNRATRQWTKYVAAPTDADITAARAAVAAAQASLQEAQYLYAALTGGTVPDNATGTGLTNLESAQLAVRSAQATVDGTKLVAPFDGTIMAVNNIVGDTVGASTVVISLSDLSHPTVEIFMDTSDWGNVKAGYAANVTFDIDPNTVYTGTVTSVDPGLYTESNTTVVRGYVKLDSVSNFNIPLGDSASVDVIAGQANNAILVPVAALHQAGDQYTVFVQQNGKLTLRVVQIGIQDASFAQVLSGLQVGDVVSTGITQTISTTTSSQ